MDVQNNAGDKIPYLCREWCFGNAYEKDIMRGGESYDFNYCTCIQCRKIFGTVY